MGLYEELAGLTDKELLDSFEAVWNGEEEIERELLNELDNLPALKALSSYVMAAYFSQAELAEYAASQLIEEGTAVNQSTLDRAVGRLEGKGDGFREAFKVLIALALKNKKQSEGS